MSGRGASGRRGFGAIEVVVLAVLLGVGVLLLLPVLTRSRGNCGPRTRCRNNLRQIGMAAICYADAKRRFPHVGPTSALDGGYDTDATPRAIRSLVYYGYHDNPEGFICPSSPDVHFPIVDDAAKSDMRRWSFEGQVSDGRLPPVVDPVWLPTLREATDLSFGWTRRGFSSTVRASTILAADRALLDAGAWVEPGTLRPGELGNHEGLNVLYADGGVSYAPLEEAVTDVRFAEVNVLRDLRWPRARTLPSPPPPAPWWAWPAALGPPACGLGLLAWWRRTLRRAAASPPRPRRFVVVASPRKGNRLRCPYCHDALGELGVVRCRACGTVLHGACAVEGCSTLGCSNAAWRPC